MSVQKIKRRGRGLGAAPARHHAISFTQLAMELKEKNDIKNSALVRRREEMPIDEASLRADEFAVYKGDIVRYAKDFFGVTFWLKQLEIIEALEHHNFVCVRSAHSTGKSYLLGILINYYFDTWYPLVGIGTAPTKALVSSVMFSYARQFRQISENILGNQWVGPAYPKMMTNEGHYFEGIVTSDPTSIQGRHGENVVILLDEAVGISPAMFESIESIMIGDNVHVLAIYNPTDPSSYVAQLEKSAGWHTVTMSAYDHPNIWQGVENLEHGLKANDSLPYPGAINLTRFEQLLKQWSFRIDKGEYDPARDIILPSSLLLNELEYYRPGPIASARLLGRWPETSLNNVYSEYVVDAARTQLVIPRPDDTVTIGVDVARFGSDFSAFCVRIGNRVVEMFEINGLSTVAVTLKVVELCKKYSELKEIPAQTIDIAVDVIGVGAGVYDNLITAGYNAHEISVSERAWQSEKYTNLRTELWFEVYDLMLSRKISLGNIEHFTFTELKKQLLAPMFSFDKSGRRQVESKDDTKKRIDRSPDLADAFLLSFAVNTEFVTGISSERG